jgi:iron(III) transport system substrate-binding protein
MRTKAQVFRLMLVGLLLVAVVGQMVFAAGSKESAKPASELDQWMQTAQLGPYQPQTEDWDEIVRLAKSEPPLTLYTETSRSFQMLETFEEKYGIKVEGINLRGNELIERVRRENNSGIHNAGVLMVGSSAVVYDQLLKGEAVVNYVPRKLQATMGRSAQDPLLVHRYSIGTWYFKNDANKDVPSYKNIWEFTTEKWRNRVAINSPLDSGTTMEYFVGLVHNSDKMEALYKDLFGKPIELTERNAGLEFIKRLLENDVRIVPAFRDVSAAVSQGQGYFAGFGAHSGYAGVVRGEYDFNLDLNVTPAVVSSRILAMGTYIKSPNTAKLLIDWFMSQEGGVPWWGDDFATNPAVVQTGYMADLSLDSFDKLWEAPLDVQLDLRDEVADLFLLYQ